MIFMLRKKESNKILKYIKAIFFASTLSLLNPLSVSAEGNITEKQEVMDINKENMIDCIEACGIVLVVRAWLYLYDRENKKINEEDCRKDSSKQMVKKIGKDGGSYERI